MPQTEVPEMQEEEEVYRVTIDDDEIFQHCAARRQQRGRPNLQSTARRESSAQRCGGSSRVSIRSGSRGSRKRQSFETTIEDNITGFREFQRQSFHPGAFDQDDYDEFKKAEAIFIPLDLPKHTRFYWACINALEELVYWRKYFIDIAASTDEDKVQLLEAMTGVYPNNQDVPKQLGSGHSFGHIQEWGTPPNAPHWGTPLITLQWRQTQKFQQVGSQGDGATMETPPIIQQTSSSGLGFTNYFETGQIPQTPRPGGLFNIYGTPQGSNANHHSNVFRICQLRSQDLNNLVYEERIELWNLENEQFEKLVVQPALNYYERYFQKVQSKLIDVWDGEIYGVDYSKMMLLDFSYY
ncbi:hypothetical protein AtEden1_Chr3g0196011 [Arabidopsis thaliana]